MPVFHTKTIESILEPVAQQVKYSHVSQIRWDNMRFLRFLRGEDSGVLCGCLFFFWGVVGLSLCYVNKCKGFPALDCNRTDASFSNFYI